MKRFSHILAACISIAAVVSSCTFELKPNEVDITSIRCIIPPIDVEEDFATGIIDTLSATKATFSGNSFLWSVGDRIGIVPNSGSQIYFAVDAGAGTSAASFDGGDWAMKSTGTFYAYYPLYPDIFLSKNHVSVSYLGQVQSGNNNNLHTGDFWTLYTEGTTAEGNTLNFTFNHLTSFFKTYVTVPAGTYTKIAFSAPSEIFIKEGYFDLSAQTPAIVGTTFTNELCLDLQNVTFADETELTGYLVLAPIDITGIPITVTVYKDGAPTYEYTLTKANPMVAAKTYAFRATALTQLASSAIQANALFAAGATAVTITTPLTENATVVLPNTSEAVTLTLPATASTSTLTISYPQNAASYPATVSITGPEGVDLDIQAPNSTVTLNGLSYDQVTSRTAANTCIIPIGVTVNNLKVVQGGVQVYGTVTQIDLSDQEDDSIISVSGSVSALLGEDDEEYTTATGLSLNQSSINLSIGSTETLIATVTPVGAYPNVIWTSSDETVATVSSTGVVSAIAAGSATISATTISGGFIASCEVAITSGYVSAIQLNKTSTILVIGATGTLSATILPNDAPNKTVSWESSDTSIATVDNLGRITAVAQGNATVTATATDGSGITASCAVSVITQPIPQAVDLGLSVKWASFNLGAANPEDYGSHFAWGETEPKSNYNWSTYQWCQGGSQYRITKYNTELDTDEFGDNYGTIDNRRVLVFADDAAHVQLGSNWRMPTVSEFQELYDSSNTSWEWVSINGVNGYRVTSKKEGYTDKSIFLPASGYRHNTNYYSEGSGICYWSSTIYLRYNPQQEAYVLSGSESSFGRYQMDRDYGLPVRPVQFVPVSWIQFNKRTTRMVPGMRESLTATILPENATNKTVTWSSDNPDIASVDSNGEIYAHGAGKTYIWATANDGSGRNEQCEVTVLEPSDLSASSSANCYMVSTTGAYSFRTTKGNSSTSVGTVSSAEVLWESYGTSTTPDVGSIISKVFYSSNTIYFLTPTSLNYGNAVIAAKDSGGNILWSWHIWVRNDAVNHTYYNSAGKMMDRNLGATSATSGTVESFGLLYQWGRKDPFLGSSNISDNYPAASTLSWPSPVNSTSSTGTLAYAIAHPTTFITYNYNNYDWFYRDDATTNTTRWKSSKTIYDPCPPGWKVPTGGSSGVWATASGVTSGSFAHTWSSTKLGMNFSGKFGSASSIWYPAAGYLEGYGGAVVGVGTEGTWWSCTIESRNNVINGKALLIKNYDGSTNNVFPVSGNFCGQACSVRCIKE